MRKQRIGFTLVELLVVIAIIGILVALLLPAVQSARESARRTQCTNNLKNLTLGMINFESTHRRLPGSGWAGHWTGDPDRGSGADQPGSWFYNILPFIELQSTYDLGKGKSGTQRQQALLDRDATPVSVMNCPSRRDGGPYPRSIPPQGACVSGDGTGGTMSYNCESVARGDYAASVGDETGYDGKCLSVSPSNYTSITTDFPPSTNSFSGVTFCGTAVKLRQITDGLTNTFALGEKWVQPEVYAEDGASPADDWHMYAGFQDDLVRSTYYDALTSSHTPRRDSENVSTIQVSILREIFGSPHRGGCLFSLCDGSVTSIEFDIDPEVYRQYGDRKDEGIIKEYERRR